jgi:hypothetical protein
MHNDHVAGGSGEASEPNQLNGSVPERGLVVPSCVFEFIKQCIDASQGIAERPNANGKPVALPPLPPAVGLIAGEREYSAGDKEFFGWYFSNHTPTQFKEEIYTANQMLEFGRQCIAKAKGKP